MSTGTKTTIQWRELTSNLLSGMASSEEWMLILTFIRQETEIQLPEEEHAGVIETSVQEMMLKLHDEQKLEQFCTAKSPKSYLRKMIQNEIVDQFREETLHKQAQRKYAERIVRTFEPDPSTAALESERSEQLRIAIDSLSSIEKDLINAFHLGDASIEQLAEKHNQTPSWVTTRLFRARAKLKTQLNNKI